jgi:NAD(P)-dependent dehydrogenase (short-subunit alcohol dehydrogenase family)
LRLEDLRQQFETNLFGVLRVTQAVLPHMRERKRGRILMMSSVAGLISPPTYGAYSSASTRWKDCRTRCGWKCFRSAWT